MGIFQSKINKVEGRPHSMKKHREEVLIWSYRKTFFSKSAEQSFGYGSWASGVVSIELLRGRLKNEVWAD